MRRRISTRAVCPFYKRETSQVIYCAGVQPGSAIHLAFASKADCLAYKNTFCKASSSRCRLCRMLDEIRQEEEEDND